MKNKNEEWEWRVRMKSIFLGDKQVCELSQVLTEAAIKRCFEK